MEVTKEKMGDWLLAARRLHAEGKYIEELEILNACQEADEYNSDVLIEFGRAYRNLGDNEKALEYYNRALMINPCECNAYINIGIICMIKGEYAKSVSYYEKALKLSSTNKDEYWVANAYYAVAVAKLGDRKRARKMIEESEAHGYPNGEAIRKMAELPEKHDKRRSKTLLIEIGLGLVLLALKYFLKD